MTHSFRSAKSPLGAFEAALERGRPEVVEDARMDYILKEGRAVAKNELVKAYLLGKNRPAPASNLAQKAAGLNPGRPDDLLEARLLAGHLIDVERDQRENKYSLSLLAEVVAHPFLNSDLVREMGEAEREAKLKELEEFYGVSVGELLAFIEFKRVEAKIEKIQMEGRKLLNLPELSEEERSQLRLYESVTLKQFFDSDETREAPAESMIEYEPAKGRGRSPGHKQPGKYVETFDYRTENESAEDKRKYYAYEPPLRHKDRERQVQDLGLVDKEILPEKFRVTPLPLEPYSHWSLSRPPVYEKPLKELSLSELVRRLRNEPLDSVERLELMRAVFQKQSEMEMNSQGEQRSVFHPASGTFRKRGEGIEVQEQIRARVAAESLGTAEADTLKRKGAFTQFDRYEPGLGLPEQTVLGVFNFAEEEGFAAKLEETKFARLLKRRIQEFLTETGLETFENRKELFLAIEKGARREQLPELEEAALLGLILHPWTFEYLHVLLHPAFFAKYSIGDAALLGEFLDFLEAIPVAHEPFYTEFLRLFCPESATEALLSQAERLWTRNYERGLPGNPLWLARTVARLQLNSGREVDANLLSSLAALRLESGQGVQSVFKDGELRHIWADPALSLCFLEVLLDADASAVPHLLKLTKDVLASLESEVDLTALFLRQLSTFGEDALRTSVVARLADYTDLLPELGGSLVLHRAFDRALELKAKYLQDELPEFESNSNSFREYVPENAVFVDYESRLLRHSKRPLVKADAHYRVLKPLVEATPMEKSLARHEQLRELYEARTGRHLPLVVTCGEEIDWTQVDLNLQVMSDYYLASVKKRISAEDATSIEEKKSAFYRNKLGRQKGLNFGRRTLRYAFSESKADFQDENENRDNELDIFKDLFETFEEVEEDDQEEFLENLELDNFQEETQIYEEPIWQPSLISMDLNSKVLKLAKQKEAKKVALNSFTEKVLELEENPKLAQNRGQMAERLLEELRWLCIREQLEKWNFQKLMEEAIKYLYIKLGQTFLVKRLMLENFKSFDKNLGQRLEHETDIFRTHKDDFLLRMSLGGRVVLRDLRRYHLRSEFQFQFSNDFIKEMFDCIKKNRSKSRPNRRIRPGHAEDPGSEPSLAKGLRALAVYFNAGSP